MNLLDKIITALSPSLGLKRERARMAQRELTRSFEAASHGHRTEGWIAPTTSANSENGPAAQTLRARSRDLIRNNPYANRALRVLVANAVGHGIIPQIKSDDETKRERIEKEWEAWAESTDCDVEGRKTFYEIQSLGLSSVIESGDCLVRIIRRNKFDRANFQLQVLEIDHLDTYKFEETATTSTRGGIEYDRKTGKRLAYWLFQDHPGESFGFGVAAITSFRIDAKDIIHIYRQDRPGQSTGIPWAACIMNRLRDFDGFEDAQLRRQIVSSSYAGFLEDSEPPMDVKIDRNGTATAKIMPGTIQHLSPGKRIVFNDPPDAGRNYSSYSSQILHAISIGYGIPYESLTGDYSQVNFSSGRMGHLEFQRQLDHVRFNMFIPQFCVPIWNQFRAYLKLKGIAVDDVTIAWVPPRREMIDPVAETKALTQAIRSGLISLNEAVTTFGVDPMDHYKELAQINDVLDEYGLKLDSDGRNMNQQGQVQIDPNQEPTKEKNDQNDSD